MTIEDAVQHETKAKAQKMAESIVDAQRLSLRAANKKLLKEIEKLKTQIGDRKEMAAAIAGAVESLDPLPLVPYAKPAKPTTPVTAILKLSDWQIGERINPREKAREAVRRMNQPRLSFRYQSIGHFHVPGMVPGGVLANGCLSGTTEFDHSCGRHAAPAQVAFLVHPRHGVFNFTPFTVE